MKKIILGSLSLLILPFFVLAEGPGERELPPESSPVWDIFAAIDRPDDPNCVNLAKAAGVADQDATEYCTAFASMPQDMYDNMSDDGMFEEGMTSTNFLNETDWHNIDDLTFDSPMGKISFAEQTVDFLNYDFMFFMNHFPERIQMRKNYVEFDASLVDELRELGAVITMKDVSPFEDPMILVDHEVDNEGVISALTYNPEEKSITFNAAHFTVFTAVDRDDPTYREASVRKVKARHFVSKNNKERVRVVVYGKGFDDDTELKLGSKEPYKIRKRIRKGEDKLEAFFDFGDLVNLGHRKLTAHIINEESSVNQIIDYEDKIDLENLKELKTEKYHYVYHKIVDYLEALSFLIK